MKEDIIYLLFDNWCNSGHEPEVIEAMKKAIQNPTEDTIFELSSTVEANAFKAGGQKLLTDDALFIYRRIGDTYVRKTV